MGIVCRKKTDRRQDAIQTDGIKKYQCEEFSMAQSDKLLIVDDFQWPIVVSEGISIAAWTLVSVN